MKNLFHPILDQVCDYLFILLGLKFNHISKRGFWYFCCCIMLKRLIWCHVIYAYVYIYIYMVLIWINMLNVVKQDTACRHNRRKCIHMARNSFYTWWRHQMETFSALLTLCAENSPVLGEFPAQRSVTRSFGVFFDLRQNKRLSKQPWGWWFETPSWSLWRQCNVFQNSVQFPTILEHTHCLQTNDTSRFSKQFCIHD